MANRTEITNAFQLVLGAGLDYSPSGETISIRLRSWLELLTDIPGEILKQAAHDLAISGEKFPSVPRIRKQAEDVKAHNGKAVDKNAFRVEKQPIHPYPLWTRRESDRLEREIGYLLKKRMDEWTPEDYTNYERAIGAKYGSEEEHLYWSHLLSSAYGIPDPDEVS